MFIGQYSAGKTSMISYLLHGLYPGAVIAPEPSTDFFTHITYSEEVQTLPGPTLVADKNYQFQVIIITNMFFNYPLYA